MKLWEGLAYLGIGLGAGVGVYWLASWIMAPANGAAVGPIPPGAMALGAQPGATYGQPRQNTLQPVSGVGVTPLGQVPPQVAKFAPLGSGQPSAGSPDAIAQAAQVAGAVLPNLVQLAKDPGIQSGIASALKSEPTPTPNAVSAQEGMAGTIQLANAIALGAHQNPVNGNSLEATGGLADFGKIGDSALAGTATNLDDFSGRSPSFDPNSTEAFVAQAEAQDAAYQASQAALAAQGYAPDAGTYGLQGGGSPIVE